MYNLFKAKLGNILANFDFSSKNNIAIFEKSNFLASLSNFSLFPPFL